MSDHTRSEGAPEGDELINGIPMRVRVQDLENIADGQFKRIMQLEKAVEELREEIKTITNSRDIPGFGAAGFGIKTGWDRHVQRGGMQPPSFYDPIAPSVDRLVRK